MKPLTTDLSIYKKFNFEYSPVGVKFLFAKPEGFKQLDKELPLCEMVMEAHRKKEAFYITKENEDCMGREILGMLPFPEYAKAGQLGVDFEVFEDSRANSRMYHHNMTFPLGTVNYIIFAPLDALTFDPDLLILITNASQAEIVMRASSYRTGELWNSVSFSVAGCAWVFAYPYKTGKVNYIVTGMNFGTKAKGIYPEGLIMISIPWDKVPEITTSLQEMKWVLPSYTDGRENFIKRERRYNSTWAKKALNP